jgi:hypothetical protein
VCSFEEAGGNTVDTGRGGSDENRRQQVSVNRLQIF